MIMFWDITAGVYDLFEDMYNRKANEGFCAMVAAALGEDDTVLECACGTGMITAAVAPYCHSIIATDFSEGMLRQAQKKCAPFANVTFEKADITSLRFPDHSFDKVIAGNVIHLLDDPAAALRELMRVCRPDGLVILPTYVNGENRNLAAKLLKTIGIDFKSEFTYESYRRFFETHGFADGRYELARGHMPCAVAFIPKHG